MNVSFNGLQSHYLVVVYEAMLIGSYFPYGGCYNKYIIKIIVTYKHCTSCSNIVGIWQVQASLGVCHNGDRSPKQKR